MACAIEFSLGALGTGGRGDDAEEVRIYSFCSPAANGEWKKIDDGLSAGVFCAR